MNTTYFAYGSNMNAGQMADRCPGASALGVARLNGWAVRINDCGVATIIPDNDAFVEGVLWDATPACMKHLDRYEGVAVGLYRRETFVVETAEGPTDAVVYVGDLGREGDPRPGYLESILVGAEHFGLSDSHLNRLRMLAGGSRLSGARGELIPDSFFDYEKDLQAPEPSADEADEVRAKLEEIRQRIADGEIGAAEDWSGADVVIESRYRARRPESFFPEPRHVVTPAAPELSWLFQQIRDIFLPTSFYEFGMKEALFGRLADVVVRCEGDSPVGAGQAALLGRVLDEAVQMLAELDTARSSRR